MNGSWYFDSSAVLAMLLGEPRALDPPDDVPCCTSAITRVECLRTLDRERLLGRLTDAALLVDRETLLRTLRSLRVVDIDLTILDRAAAPASVPLRTLDAIHLSTALRWKEDSGEEVLFATHDRSLAAAARAYGLEVVGA